jgi:hypothetical protein
MKVDWKLTPRMLFNQLSGREQAEISDAAQFLANGFTGDPTGQDIQRLKVVPGDNGELFVMKVARDFRLIFARHDDAIAIVDLFPISQIEGLKSARRSR